MSKHENINCEEFPSNDLVKTKVFSNAVRLVFSGLRPRIYGL